MSERKTYVYRLHVYYPEGSDALGWEPPGWDPPLAPMNEPDWDGSFRWPAVRPYLSRSGAARRAKLLRSYGAVVEVFRSMPVEWPCPGGCHEFYGGQPCDCPCHLDEQARREMAR